MAGYVSYLLKVSLRVCTFSLLGFALCGLLPEMRTAQAAEQSLDRQLNQLNIVTEEFPPFSFTNAQGELDGLATEVVREIMRRLDMHQPIRVKPWARAYRETVNGDHNMLFSVSYTKQRSPLFQWVGSIYTLHSNLYAKSGSGIRVSSMREVKRLPEIGSYRDSMDAQILQAKGVKNLDIVTDNVQNIRKLMAGRVSVIAASDITLAEMVKQAGYQFEQLEMLYTFATTEGYIVFSRQVPTKVVALWQQTLQEMEQEGELRRIQEKWCSTRCW